MLIDIGDQTFKSSDFGVSQFVEFVNEAVDFALNRLRCQLPKIMCALVTNTVPSSTFPTGECELDVTGAIQDR